MSLYLHTLYMDVTQDLQNAVYDTLPMVRPSRPQRYKDDTLLALCSNRVDGLKLGIPLGPLYIIRSAVLDRL